jgi:probable phosphoglycerate mutase
MTDPTLQQTSFWFLRHGETDWNAQNLSQGAVDIPLNAKGLEQARAAALKLTGRGIAAIVSSPVPRARVTAEIVGAALALPVTFDDDLREASYGVREGQPMAEWFQEWVDGVSTPDQGEPFADLLVRAVAAINRCLAQPAPVLVVAHGGLFRAIRKTMGLEANIRTPNATPYWCQPGSPAWTLTPAV